MAWRYVSRGGSAGFGFLLLKYAGFAGLMVALDKAEENFGNNSRTNIYNLARRLAKYMRYGLRNNTFGLEPNSESVAELKDDDIPLVDTGFLSSGNTITVKKLKEGRNEVAYLVGVPDDGKMPEAGPATTRAFGGFFTRSPNHHKKTLFEVVSILTRPEGWTAVISLKGGAKMFFEVPERDFITRARNGFEKEFSESVDKLGMDCIRDFRRDARES